MKEIVDFTHVVSNEKADKTQRKVVGSYDIYGEKGEGRVS